MFTCKNNTHDKPYHSAPERSKLIILAPSHDGQGDQG